MNFQPRTPRDGEAYLAYASTPDGGILTIVSGYEAGKVRYSHNSYPASFAAEYTPRDARALAAELMAAADAVDAKRSNA